MYSKKKSTDKSSKRRSRSPPQVATSSKAKHRARPRSDSPASPDTESWRPNASGGDGEDGEDGEDGIEELKAFESYKPKKTAQLFKSFAANAGADTKALKAAKAKAERQDVLKGFHQKSAVVKKRKVASKESKSKRERSSSPEAGPKKMRGAQPAKAVFIAGIVWMRKGIDEYKDGQTNVPEIGTIKKWAKQGFAVHYDRDELSLPTKLNAEEAYAWIKKHLPAPIVYQEKASDPKGKGKSLAPAALFQLKAVRKRLIVMDGISNEEEEDTEPPVLDSQVILSCLPKDFKDKIVYLAGHYKMSLKDLQSPSEAGDSDDAEEPNPGPSKKHVMTPSPQKSPIMTRSKRLRVISPPAEEALEPSPLIPGSPPSPLIPGSPSSPAPITESNMHVDVDLTLSPTPAPPQALAAPFTPPAAAGEIVDLTGASPGPAPASPGPVEPQPFPMEIDVDDWIPADLEDPFFFSESTRYELSPGKVKKLTSGKKLKNPFA